MATLDQLAEITDPLVTDQLYAEPAGRSRRMALGVVRDLLGAVRLERRTGSGGTIDLALPAGFRALRIVGRAELAAGTTGTLIARLSRDGGSSFRTSAYAFIGWAIRTTEDVTAHFHPGSANVDASAFHLYADTTSERTHRFELVLTAHDLAQHWTMVDWAVLIDRSTLGVSVRAEGAVEANEAHDMIRITRSAGSLGAYDLTLYGLLP